MTWMDSCLCVLCVMVLCAGGSEEVGGPDSTSPASNSSPSLNSAPSPNSTPSPNSFPSPTSGPSPNSFPSPTSGPSPNSFPSPTSGPSPAPASAPSPNSVPGPVSSPGPTSVPSPPPTSAPGPSPGSDAPLSSNNYTSHGAAGGQPTAVATEPRERDNNTADAGPAPPAVTTATGENASTAPGSTGQGRPGATATPSQVVDAEVTAETVSAETTSTAPAGGTGDPSGSSDTAGTVILIFILCAIIILAVTLYILRRNSRKYSFDLHRPGHDHDTSLTFMDQRGSVSGGFMCVKEEDCGENALPNGHAQQTGETGERGETGPARTPPIKKVGFSLDNDLSDGRSGQSGASSALDLLEAELQNQNNNNMSTGDLPGLTYDLHSPGVTFEPEGSDDVFMEISLDETTV